MTWMLSNPGGSDGKFGASKSDQARRWVHPDFGSEFSKGIRTPKWPNALRLRIYFINCPDDKLENQPWMSRCDGDFLLKWGDFQSPIAMWCFSSVTFFLGWTSGFVPMRFLEVEFGLGVFFWDRLHPWKLWFNGSPKNHPIFQSGKSSFHLTFHDVGVYKWLFQLDDFHQIFI